MRNRWTGPKRSFGADADRLRRGGDAAGAVRLCRQGLDEFPDQVSGRVTLGLALLDLGQMDDARVELDAAYKSAPDNLAAIRGLAELHAKTEEAEMLSMEHDSDWAAGLADAAAAEAAAAKAAVNDASEPEDDRREATDELMAGLVVEPDPGVPSVESFAESFELGDDVVDRIAAAVEAGDADPASAPTVVDLESADDLVEAMTVAREQAAAFPLDQTADDPPSDADDPVIDLDGFEAAQLVGSDGEAPDARIREALAAESEAAEAREDSIAPAPSAAEDAWQLADLMEEGDPIQPLVSEPADGDRDGEDGEDDGIESSVAALKQFLRRAEARRTEVRDDGPEPRIGRLKP